MKHSSIKFLLTLACLLSTGTTFADPTDRVARLSYIKGSATFLATGATDWVDATLNRPLVTGDRLWTTSSGRIELQLNATAIRLSSDTDLTFLNLNSTLAQFQLNQGKINLHVWQIAADQTYEVDTPNLAFTTTQAGNYRISVDTNSTRITLLEGQAFVYGENAAYVLQAPNSYAFSGTNLSVQDDAALNDVETDFDTWSMFRDEQLKNSTSLKYVSNNVIGYEDLNQYGEWQENTEYGNVWIPNNMTADWAPYKEGNWVWIEPWGWTWIDDQPWGFAPFHYGRWVYLNEAWAWAPGPTHVEPIYAPALVAFFDTPAAQTTVAEDNNMIGWVALGPGDAYVPPYQVSQNYFYTINQVTVINNIYLANIYANRNFRHHYRNLRTKNAFTAMPNNAFIHGYKASRAGIYFPPNKISNVRPIRPHFKPLPGSIVGHLPPSQNRPPKNILTRPVIVKTSPTLKPNPLVPLSPNVYQQLKYLNKPIPVLQATPQQLQQFQKIQQQQLKQLQQIQQKQQIQQLQQYQKIQQQKALQMQQIQYQKIQQQKALQMQQLQQQKALQMQQLQYQKIQQQKALQMQQLQQQKALQMQQLQYQKIQQQKALQMQQLQQQKALQMQQLQYQKIQQQKALQIQQLQRQKVLQMQQIQQQKILRMQQQKALQIQQLQKIQQLKKLQQQQQKQQEQP